jgi:hypothetical protein
MRAILVVGLLALLCPAAALAQAAPTPATPSTASARAGAAATRGGDITRDQYIERAVERAKRAAEARFDRMDTNHDGVLTAEERRAARAERTQRRASPSQ